MLLFLELWKGNFLEVPECLKEMTRCALFVRVRGDTQLYVHDLEASASAGIDAVLHQ